MILPAKAKDIGLGGKHSKDGPIPIENRQTPILNSK